MVTQGHVCTGCLERLKCLPGFVAKRIQVIGVKRHRTHRRRGCLEVGGPRNGRHEDQHPDGQRDRGQPPDAPGNTDHRHLVRSYCGDQPNRTTHAGTLKGGQSFRRYAREFEGTQQRTRKTICRIRTPSAREATHRPQQSDNPGE